MQFEIKNDLGDTLKLQLPAGEFGLAGGIILIAQEGIQRERALAEAE